MLNLHTRAAFIPSITWLEKRYLKKTLALWGHQVTLVEKRSRKNTDAY